MGDLITLSRKELVECDNAYNQGCNVDLMDYDFQFIIDNDDFDSDIDYPYRARDGVCDQHRSKGNPLGIKDLHCTQERPHQHTARARRSFSFFAALGDQVAIARFPKNAMNLDSKSLFMCFKSL
ncbi:probable cysteine protease RD21B [Zingiber officinale]|uniref:probable cysteine protease RD21B n=1 Tax=Zingiber officinale TaxID=94328 RepID=UPI001C4BC352|nr:probable cysteine protease RD21B [Zingiber officinale]